jgi:hypothetical protein
MKSRAASPALLALFACLVTSGCYLGSARNARLADLAGDDGWEFVEGVPAVRQAANEDCGAAALGHGPRLLEATGLPATAS